MRRHSSERSRAFTLVELLTVIAIISVLVAILIPSVQGVRRSAHKARTRVLFGQWAAAIESFRSEYGYYPMFDGSGLVNPPGQSSSMSATHLFHDVLAGKRRDGTALPAEAQNRKRIAFRTFSESEFDEANLLQDGSGNSQIAVIVDRNLDGRIDAEDFGGSLPVVSGMRPGAEDFPASGIRAGVIFYAPAEGATAMSPGFVFSWK